MSAKVIIEWAGLQQMISNLAAIEEKAPQNIGKQVATLAKDTEQFWRQATPRRTGQLQGADKAEPSGLSFTLNNATRYYDWVSEGHRTPSGWRTKRGYRPAKRRSYVKGQEMTSKTVQFVEQNIEKYLSKFLDDV
jgi:hypothetical protein